MFARIAASRRRRRGVILVVVLGMLSLLALIGVTFATFSGQARVNSRNFAQSQNFPDSSEMMDYALSQLINDTGKPTSALRGHSLKRDMYGNDAYTNGYVDTVPSLGVAPQITAVNTSGGFLHLTTNIPVADPGLYGYDFTRWIVKVPPYYSGTAGQPYYVGQTHEVLVDDQSGTNHVFTVASPGTPYAMNAALSSYTSGDPNFPTTSSQLILAPVNANFVLDGRYLHAFNGPGQEGFAGWGNFRVNGDLFVNGPGSTNVYAGDPNNLGMDEDYDAVDLENWYLAMQSADGSVMIPSFHRPGIIRGNPSNPTDPSTNDWRNTSSPDSMARILRPRNVDGHSVLSFPDLTPDVNGRITYDVDNDGDGSTDSIWLDLGYPALRDAESQLYKPLFAFMVIGLNGRLPLNTAGNLQQRDVNGYPLFMSASHLGNSPSEIDPTYALQAPNFPNYSQVDNAGFKTAGDAPIPVSVTQLRNLLAGTRLPDLSLVYGSPPSYSPTANQDANLVAFGQDSAGNAQYYVLPNGVNDAADVGGGTSTIQVSSLAVTGRWGEGDSIPTALLVPYPGNTGATPAIPPAYRYMNPVRAGISAGTALTNADARDDNFNTYDPFNGENRDYYDAAGGLALPVERIRRFVTPFDAAGDGAITVFNPGASSINPPLTAPTGGSGPNYLPTPFAPYGPDARGRVSYFKYFRPPGVPNQSFGGSASPPIPNTPTAYTSTSFPTNALHGHEAARNPNFTVAFQASGGTQLTNLLAAGMPFDVGNDTSTPTFDGVVNSHFLVTTVVPTSPTTPPNYWASPSGYYVISADLNEADEMRLDQPTPVDDPFGANDLQWLYRQQDSDGAQLSSRLANLAPISFNNPIDGLRRRRLFALDSWETNGFVWAYDNPGNMFLGNASASPPIPGNATCAAITNYATANPLANASLYAAGVINGATYPTPSLAHRDRKINLNYPLPISTNPDEPVRQKWIMETYQLLKRVLPYQSLDSPEELAQLSQYLTNVIDFRDPDAVCTHFHNPDVLGGIDQYGMEYSPVAINEVLAYSYQFKTKNSSGNGAAATQNRFFLELVNTLTESGDAPYANTAFTGQTPAATNNWTNSSTLDLSNWDLIIVPDMAGTRPDRLTGQLPSGLVLNTNYWQVALQQSTFMPISGGAAGSAPPVQLSPLTSAAAATADNQNAPGTATTQAYNYYYVIGNDLTPTKMTANGNPFIQEATPPSSQASPPQVVSTLIDNPPGMTTAISDPFNPKYPDTTAMSFTPIPAPSPGTGQQLNYWVCLRRPANPFAAPNTSPMVVVDAMRFPYIEGGGTVTTVDPDTTMNLLDNVTAGTAPIYSVERLQPYRGGQAVPMAVSTGVMTTVTAVDPRYGYTEQLVPSTGSTGNNGIFSIKTNPGPPVTTTPNKITGPINHTLGKVNSTTDASWDLLTFHDRDFTSVAELLLVPGCPPGLFTKQFVENPPSTTFPTITPVASTWTAPSMGATPTPNPTAATRPAAPATASTPLNPVHTYPFLIDNFFYSAPSAVMPAAYRPNAPSTWTDWQASGSGVPWPMYNNTYPAGSPYNGVGGPGGAGWYKMFEFFEVPSPSFGSIGPVAQGFNYDWLRNDIKPGLLNLNLIIDEEVFLGLMGNAGLINTANFWGVAQGGNGQLTDIPPPPALNGNQVPSSTTETGEAYSSTAMAGASYVPKVVTMIDATGAPAILTPASMSSSGRLATTPIANQGYAAFNGSGYSSHLKAAFCDFLALRHGGSGYLFGWGSGLTGQSPNLTVRQSIAVERPFHSLSYPDIDYTILRPAALPPPFAPLGGPSGTGPSFTLANSTTQPSPFYWDPGVKNPYVSIINTGAGANPPVLPPAIPPRRLFQIPDSSTNPGNASLTGDSPYVNTYIADSSLVNPTYDLTSGTSVYLQGGLQHPSFRSEWLQKVTNLTTVRTHQYAVWITVAFFEVVDQGDPALAATNPLQAMDILGNELGLLSGKNVRYRSFFLVDRTKAIGFNPNDPGDFRACVVYRQPIEF